MIDRLTVLGTLKTLELGDLMRGARVMHAQRSSANLKPAADYLTSPITGAQMELTLQSDVGPRTEHLEGLFKIPLASALLGQNYMHGWTECLNAELKTASQLIRVVLENAYSFRPEEASRYIESAEILSTEWTWHIATSSYRAAKNLLTRVYQQIAVLHQHKSRHDIGVENYSFIDEAGRTSLKVYLKNGSAMKFYVKVDEMADKRRKPRGSALFEKQKVNSAEIKLEIGAHLRVEAIPGKKQLSEHNMLNPAAWLPESVEAVVDEILSLAGFMTPYSNEPRKLDVSACSEPAQRMFALYCQDGALTGVSEAQKTRHRQALLPLGVDIAIAPEDHRFLSATIGRQLHYSKRWKVPDRLRLFMMSEKTLPVLQETLSQMLAVGRAENTSEKLAQLELQRFQDLRLGKRPRPKPLHSEAIV